MLNRLHGVHCAYKCSSIRIVSHIFDAMKEISQSLIGIDLALIEFFLLGISQRPILMFYVCTSALMAEIAD